MPSLFELDEQDVLKRLDATKIPAKSQRKILADIAATLHSQVGLRLEEELTDEQLAAFADAADDDDKALEWLEANVPNYSQLFTEELDKIVDDMKSLMDEVLGSK
jgi:hypothetical protein